MAKTPFYPDTAPPPYSPQAYSAGPPSPQPHYSNNYPSQPPTPAQQNLQPVQPIAGNLSPKHSPYNSPYLKPQQSPQPSISPAPPVNPTFAGTMPRTLHIYSSSNSGHILDSNKATVLYNYETHSIRKPHVRLSRAVPNGLQTPIGSATFHSFSSTIDIAVNSANLSLSSNGLFRSGHKFQSSVPGIGLLKWQLEGLCGTSKNLVDEQGRALARYENSNWALKKEGKLNLMGPTAQNGLLMDEVVISALAEIENDHRQQAASAGG